MGGGSLGILFRALQAALHNRLPIFVAFYVVTISALASLGAAVLCGIEAFAILQTLALLAVAAPAFSRFRQCGDAIG